MNKLMVVTAMALCAASLGAMPLAEARGKTDAVIASLAEMTKVMKQLSAADQKAFLADVNEALGKLPGSVEERAAKVVQVNRAALKGAARGNAKELAEIVAEVFATAPLDALCLLNESLAKDAFNRAADPSRVYTDEQFTKIAKELVAAVNARVAGSEDAEVRSGFAALTMIRASNGTPASLVDELAAMLGSSAEVAKTEWFPEALKSSNYDPMLVGTKVEKYPDSSSALAIAGAQRYMVLLDAFYEGEKNPNGVLGSSFGDYSRSDGFDHGLYTRPRTTKDKPWNPDTPVKPDTPVTPEPVPPKPYDYQTYE